MILFWFLLQLQEVFLFYIYHQLFFIGSFVTGGLLGKDTTLGNKATHSLNDLNCYQRSLLTFCAIIRSLLISLVYSTPILSIILVHSYVHLFLLQCNHHQISTCTHIYGNVLIIIILRTYNPHDSLFILAAHEC